MVSKDSDTDSGYSREEDNLNEDYLDNDDDNIQVPDYKKIVQDCFSFLIYLFYVRQMAHSYI